MKYEPVWARSYARFLLRIKNCYPEVETRSTYDGRPIRGYRTRAIDRAIAGFKARGHLRFTAEGGRARKTLFKRTDVISNSLRHLRGGLQRRHVYPNVIPAS